MMSFSRPLAGIHATVVATILLSIWSAHADLVITNIVRDPDGIVLSGAGGEPNGTYTVLSATNLAMPMTNWPAIATNNFNSVGHFTWTNRDSPGLRENYFGLLTLTAPTNTTPDFSLVGFATVNGTVTGGAGAGTGIVTTASQFTSAVNATSPSNILVSGAITLTGTANFRSRKTVIGLGTNATILGPLSFSGVSNIILRNLHISNPAGLGNGDGATLQNGARNIWIDHCTFGECTDGQIDIVTGSDYVTVSWCRFYYTNAASTHRFSSLVGNSETNEAQDSGKLHVTYHHNWWSTLVHERMPRVRFGRVHAFNNYFFSPGNNYCIRASIQSEVLSERNYYRQVDEPYNKFTELDQTGLIKALDDIRTNCTGVIVYNDAVFTPPYSYVPDVANNVPNIVTNWAGAGTSFFP